MRFGFHVSIAGGLSNAIAEARARKCQTIQIFSRNPQGWHLKALDPTDVASFRAGIRDEQICPVAIHMPYLPNLAAENAELWEKSIEATVEDLARAQTIGAQYVVVHMGRRREASEADGLKRMIAAVNRAFQVSGRRAPAADSPRLLLENTSGMGRSLGCRFEDLKTVIDGVEDPNRLGVVLDTAHAFEAGYELRTRDGIDQTLREFDATVGLKRLHLLHLNDSKTEFASRVDRHWHIGKGRIGRDGFKRIVNHPLLRHLPGIMETPRLGLKDDLANLRAVRALEDTERARRSPRPSQP